jgi:hypothetical protein
MLRTGPTARGISGVLVLRSDATKFAGLIDATGTYYYVNNFTSADVNPVMFAANTYLNGLAFSGSNITLYDTAGTAHTLVFPVAIATMDSIRLSNQTMLTSVTINIFASSLSVDYTSSTVPNSVTINNITSGKPTSIAQTVIAALFAFALLSGAYYLGMRYMQSKMSSDYDEDRSPKDSTTSPNLLANTSNNSNGSTKGATSNGNGSKFAFDQ